MPGISAVSPPISAQPACSQPAAMPLTTSAATGDVELAAGEVVEEEQRLGALHEDVVDAHRHQVDADRVVAASASKASLSLVPTPSVPETSTGSRYFFGSSTQGAEAADAAQHLGPHGALGEGLDAFDQRVARVDVDAGVAVGEGFGNGHGIGNIVQGRGRLK